MNFAKVLNNSIVKYFYTWDDLQQENPGTTYDSRYSLPTWFSFTKLAKQGYSLQPVKELDMPTEYDHVNFMPKIRTTLEYNQVDGWHIGWDLVEKPSIPPST